MEQKSFNTEERSNQRDFLNPERSEGTLSRRNVYRFREMH
jgi:hypothetical protein